MLLSLGAGGVGLNLVGANHLFLLDMHWNPQLERQVSVNRWIEIAMNILYLPNSVSIFSNLRHAIEYIELVKRERFTSTSFCVRTL